MAHIKIARGFELQYWTAHKDKKYDRGSKILSLFPIDYDKTSVVADVGCGPKCGIFSARKFHTMYAIDPLWTDYENNKLTLIPSRVELIETTADSFKTNTLCDLIVSANALDHSGDLEKSIENIVSNLVYNGLFAMHVHMRTKYQLNKGHKMVITEEQIDEIFSDLGLEILHKKIYDECPLENKEYTTYTSVVKRI